MNKYLLILMSVIIGLLIANIPLNADNHNSKDKYYNVIRSTVRLRVDQYRQMTGSGTVFKVLKKKNVYYNYIITANHVTDNQQMLFAEYFEYENMHSMKNMITFPALNVAHNSSSDLALLVCVSETRMENAVALLSSKAAAQMKIMDDVFVSGCPLSRMPQITRGSMSVFDEKHGINSFCNLISAPVIFGSSGGGVYNEDGLLMGVVSAVSTTRSNVPGIEVAYPNIGWIVPSRLIYDFLLESGHGFLIDVKDGSSFTNALRIYNDQPIYR